MSPPVPDLMTYLAHRFEEELRSRNVGQEAFCQQQLANSQAFLRFCRSYLALHRPRSTFTALDDNLGVQLSNNDHVVLAPHPEAAHAPIRPATIQDAGAVPITGRTKAPPGAINYATADGQGAPINKMAQTPARNFAKEKLTVDPLTGQVHEA